MTLHYTANHEIAYCDVDTAAVDLAAASQQAAATIDAALTRGGVAPPNAADLVTVAGRVTGLESPVTALLTLNPGYGAASGSGAPRALSFTNRLVFLTGAVTSGSGYTVIGAGGVGSLGVMVGAPFRPLAGTTHRFTCPLIAGGAFGSALVAVGSDGSVVVVPSISMAAGFTLDLSACRWSLDY